MAAGTDNYSTNNSGEYNKHTKKYTKLLKNYTIHTEFSNELKITYKKIFFWIIIIIMGAMTIAFIVSLYKAFDIITYLSVTRMPIPTESIVGIMTAVVSSFVTMLVSLFKLPEIIAQYLFNPKEDENMAAIIGHIQTYDIGMYTIEKKLEEKYMKEFEKKVNNDQKDSTAETEEPIGNPTEIVSKLNTIQESN